MKRFPAALILIIALILTCLPVTAETTGLTITGSLELEYANQFSVDFCEGGYSLITISDGARFLTIPEGAQIPDGLPEDIVTLQLPLDNLLISSTPTVSLINAIGALDTIATTTQEYEGWYIDEVKAAMDEGKLAYIGSYKAPDFEVLTANKPPFAVFSTMIDSVPEVAEKLAEIGIPFMRDCSTYENHPLGRMEWIKLYGVLLGKEAEAQAHFDAQKALIDAIPEGSTGKTVAMFYITSKGDLYTRRAGDYMVKMLELAGGEYVLPELAPDKSGTQKIEAEEFYIGAGEADYIVYIWSMGGKPATMEEFLARSPILADFKAVKEGNAWCTTESMYQQTDKMGTIIEEMNRIFSGRTDGSDLTYIFRLE